MANEKRLTWKRSLDGFEDVGLRDGVTVGEAICKLAELEDKDAVEVVHGYWIDTPHAYGFVSPRCSVCLQFSKYHEKFNYCPNCGAKMDGDGNA